jgi:hypothetical protein
MEDTLKLGIAYTVPPLLLIGGISFILHFFVALSSPPTQRAAWTTGISYLFVSILVTLAAPEGYAVYGPLAALPGALIVFWFWRNDFRRGWVADAEAAPTGATLANDDWRIGVLQMLAFLTLAIGVAVIREFARGAF